MRRPLFPRKQTWIGPARAGKLGEFQRFSPGGLFGLSFNFLRMNQDHRSASSSRQRIDHPHPEGLTTRLVPVEVDLKPQIFDVCSPQQRTFTKGAVLAALWP